MGVRFDAWRLSLGAVGVAAALMAAGLGFGVIGLSPAAASPGDAVEEEPWKAAAHPSRTVVATVTIEKVPDLRQNSLYGYVARGVYEFVIDPGDPLFMPLVTGEVSGDELVGWVARGDGEAESDPVTVQRIKGGPAHVTVTSTLRYGSGGAGTHSMTGTFELERAPGVDESGQAAAAAERRILTVRSDSASIVGVTGGDVVEQDANRVVFDGPPTGVSVTVYEKDPDPRFLGGPPHGPFDALGLTTAGNSLLTMIVVLGPWLAIVVTLRRFRGAFWWVGAQVIAVALALWLLLGSWLNPHEWHWGELGAAAAVALLAVRGRQASGLSGPDLGHVRRRLLIASALALVAVGAAMMIYGDSYSADPDSLAFAALLAVAVAALYAAWQRTAWLTGVTLGLFLGLVTIASSILATDSLVDLGLPFLVAAGALGVGCVTVAFRAPANRPALRWAAFLVGLVLFVPLIRSLIGIEQVPPFGAAVDAASAAILVFDVALLASLVAVLYLRASHSTVVGNVTVWALALAALLVVATDRGRLVQFNAVATVLLMMSWWLLAPWRGRGKAVTLARVDSDTHRRLVGAEADRRLAEQCAQQSYRSAPARLRDHTMDLGQHQERQQQLDDAASRATKSIEGVPVEDALATMGAAKPVESALAAMLCALPVAALIIGYEWWTLLTSDLATVVNATPLQLTLIVAHTVRWLVYAGLYGLFYSLLRGRNPIRKANTLVLLVLPAELLSVLSSINPSVADGTGITTLPQMFLALAIRTGQVVVLCLFLGLAWERRLALLAGQHWYRLRNVRSLRALAAPVGTVLIAVATTFGTAIASAAVAGLLSTGTGANPPNSPTSSTSTSTDPPR
ncbi:hypothetical protein ACQPZX_12215 [Actinoplanes sp. CA-142083]|uniref:hypothetical protein n=1 Tax=Actinoplanes sp. CA-142083 TaxID=3239903 RepID=UPI003D92ECD4